MTRILIGICVVVFMFEQATGTDLAWNFGLAGVAVLDYHEYYRLVTAMFLHGGFIHILFNMMILWQLGTALESFLGSGRFLSLYLASGLGGGLASMFLNDPMTISVGASGAIFGLMGAYVVFARRLHLNSQQIIGLIGVNLVIGFIVPGIDWHAHVGGLVTGYAVASMLSLRRS